MVYDGDGNRVKKIVGTTTNTYLVDNRNPSGYAQVLEEKTGSTTNLYTYGLDLISQRQVGGTANYYGYDGNGSTRFLTSTSAAVTDTYAYDAFGVLLTSAGTTANFYRYSGEQYDPNLGFVYLRDRYLNPNSGRFMSRDSYAGKIFDPPSLHRYTYAGNDPINHSDPTGKDFGFTLVGLLVTVAIIAVLAVGIRYAIVHVGQPVAQQLAAIPLNDNDLNAARAQLRRYSAVDAKFGLLNSALDDERVYVRVFNGAAAGQHFELNSSTLFIANTTITHGALATALVMFAEFQHDPQSGEVQDEPTAQVEFVRVRDAIRAIDPNAITPYINALQHGNGGF
jgi:RHS repeat-associated protein